MSPRFTPKARGEPIFVSHGGEAFPSLILVLQGYGITIDLVGSTYISPQGLTSTTFKTVPDEPLTSFQMTLPEGPYSALAAIGNLCKAKTTVTVKKRIVLKRHGHVIRRHGRVLHVTRKVKRSERGLRMPSEFIAQNGAVVRQDTKITVTSCGKAKPAKKVKKATKRKTRRNGPRARRR